MYFFSFQTIVLGVLALQYGLTLAATDDKKPCIIQSPNTGSSYDLTPLSLYRKDGKAESWKVKGHDYPTNFTLNICVPVVEELTKVVGIKDTLFKNVSAYYEHKGEKYSIGYVPQRNLTWRSQTEKRC
jgi:cation-dependent mannose-6-phosphate receptor